MTDNNIPTVSYYEKRTVNIGDYENVEFCLTISGVSVTNKNFGNKSATITASDKSKVQDGDINTTIESVVKKVKTTLNQIEQKIRLQTSTWAGMGFDTEAKAVLRKVVDKDYEYQNHFGKRMNLGEDD